LANFNIEEESTIPDTKPAVFTNRLKNSYDFAKGFEWYKEVQKFAPKPMRELSNPLNDNNFDDVFSSKSSKAKFKPFPMRFNKNNFHIRNLNNDIMALQNFDEARWNFNSSPSKYENNLIESTKSSKTFDQNYIKDDKTYKEKSSSSNYLNFNKIINKTNLNNDLKSSSIWLSRDKIPLPWLTPGIRKDLAKEKKNLNDDSNPFMRKVRINHTFDKRTSFKLRSANPSWRRRKHMGYLNLDQSSDTRENMRPKIMFYNPSLGSVEADSNAKYSMYSNKSSKSINLTLEPQNNNILKCQGIANLKQKFHPEASTESIVYLDNNINQKYSLKNYIKRKKRYNNKPYDDSEYSQKHGRTNSHDNKVLKLLS